jgi:hypothetical protein
MIVTEHPLILADWWASAAIRRLRAAEQEHEALRARIEALEAVVLAARPDENKTPQMQA